MPSGSSPLTGSSSSSVARVAEQGGGDAEALAHPEGEPTRAAVGDIGEANLVEHLVDTAAVDAVGVGQPAQVTAGAAPGVDGSGFEQGTDVAQREAQVSVGVPVDGDST